MHIKYLLRNNNLQAHGVHLLSSKSSKPQGVKNMIDIINSNDRAEIKLFKIKEEANARMGHRLLTIPTIFFGVYRDEKTKEFYKDIAELVK